MTGFDSRLQPVFGQNIFFISWKFFIRVADRSDRDQSRKDSRIWSRRECPHPPFRERRWLRKRELGEDTRNCKEEPGVDGEGSGFPDEKQLFFRWICRGILFWSRVYIVLLIDMEQCFLLFTDNNIWNYR